MLSLGNRRCTSRQKNIYKKKDYNFIIPRNKKQAGTGSKGVRKTNKYKVIYLTNKPGGRGVRNDRVIYSLPEQETKHTLHHMLHYHKPCVCGSLRHVRTTHVSCLLNPRYDDV